MGSSSNCFILMNFFPANWQLEEGALGAVSQDDC